MSDVDGNTEERGGTISVFNGPEPQVHVVDRAEAEAALVGRWLADRAAEGVTPGEMSVFIRSRAEVPRALAAAEAAGLPVTLLDDEVKTGRDRVSVGTMH